MPDTNTQCSEDGQSFDPELIVFNLKKRYTGVSATINALVPIQLKQWQLGFCGTTMSNGVNGMSLWHAIKISRQPLKNRPFRIWHVRRDPEMIAAIFARDVLRLPIKLVFTSAAKHRHSAFPRWLISKMNAVIATTEGAACFVPNTKKVVPHGIDLQRFVPPADKANIWQTSGLPGEYGVGVFGRLRRDKGTDIFVDAMLEALPQLPGVTAIIAGAYLGQKVNKNKVIAANEQLGEQTEDYLTNLKQKIQQHGLSDRIIFLGEVSATEVAIWYQRCLVNVACPRYEPFGLTPFEAAACGCAVICSRTGAFEDLVEPGVNGELVPTGDAPALTKALLSVLKKPSTALAMGQKARKKVVNEFSLEREAAGIGDVYQMLWNENN